MFLGIGIVCGGFLFGNHTPMQVQVHLQEQDRPTGGVRLRSHTRWWRQRTPGAAGERSSAELDGFHHPVSEGLRDAADQVCKIFWEDLVSVHRERVLRYVRFDSAFGVPPILEHRGVDKMVVVGRAFERMRGVEQHGHTICVRIPYFTYRGRRQRRCKTRNYIAPAHE